MLNTFLKGTNSVYVEWNNVWQSEWRVRSTCFYVHCSLCVL